MLIPCPARYTTTISFAIQSSIKQSGKFSITIYNCIGQIVREFKGVDFKKGENEIRWDGRNEAGRSLPSGVYFYRVSLKENEKIIISTTKKLIKLK